MSQDFALDCRFTQPFVTDPANCTYCLADEIYPTTRGGGVFGYSNAFNVQPRDRNSGNDPRIAGVHFNQDSSNSYDLRVDLAAAVATTVYLAMGDVNGTFTCQADVRDSAGLLFTLGPTSVAGGSFMDANGSIWTAANWPASNTGRLVTPVSSYLLFRFAVATGGGTAQSFLNHIRVVQASATKAPPSFLKPPRFLTPRRRYI